MPRLTSASRSTPSSTQRAATSLSDVSICLLPQPPRFGLTSLLSAERSLVSLARALVREESRVVILDEATAAVDMESDSQIQNTIRRSLKDKTLLCIAHRLRTIIHYDRILVSTCGSTSGLRSDACVAAQVMDNGSVAEFGAPLDLFRAEGSIFHELCQKSSIEIDEIERAVLLASSS